MSEFTLYRPYIKYRRPVGSISWQMVLPMQISYTDGSGHTTVLEAQSTHCGYIPPIEPQYRWVNLPINNYYDCDEEYNMYYLQKKQVSMDNGASWSDVSPSETRRGALYESQSITCGYVEPVFYKFGFDGIASAVCDDTSAITKSDVEALIEMIKEKYQRSQYNPNLMNIGDCVETIYTIQGPYNTYPLDKLTGITFGENVKEIKYDAFYLSELTELDFNDSIETIGTRAFGRNMISSLTFPESIKNVAENILSDNPVEYYEFEGNTPPLTLNQPRLDIPIIPIFVNDNAVSAYRTAFPELSDVIMGQSNKTVLGYLRYGRNPDVTPYETYDYTWYDTNYYKVAGTNIPEYQHITEDKVLDIRKLLTATSYTLEGVEIGKDVSVIRPYSFSLRTNTAGTAFNSGTLKSLTFEEPSSLRYIDNNAFNHAFVNYTGDITGQYTVRLPEGLLDIGTKAFCSCGKVANFHIPSTVTNIGTQAFYDLNYASAASTVNFRRNIFMASTTPPSIGYRAFATSADAPLYRLNIYVPSSAINTYKTAADWSEYASVIYPVDRMVIGFSDGTSKTVYADGEIAPVHNYQLSGDTIYRSEVSDAREGGSKIITSVVISEGIEKIQSGSFFYNPSLSSVTLPSTLTTIEYSAFDACPSLTAITIPSAVTSIGDNAFNDSSGLTRITVEAETPPSLGTAAFDNTNNCPIYVPANSVSTYKTTGRWQNYADRIQAIPT